jgi:hypothetical protein
MASDALTPMAANFGQNTGPTTGGGMLQTASGILSGLLQGAGGGPTVSKLVDMSSIDVAPVGVNLGEIVKPYQEGSPANGGYGITLPSRYLPDQNATDSESINNKTVTMPAKKDNGLPIIPIAIGAGGFFLAIFLFRGRG